MAKSAKFPRLKGNRGRGTRWCRQILDRKWKYGRFACAVKNMECNAYLWPNRRNSRVMKEIRVEEHDGDVRFWTGRGNIALSFMRHASGHNYRNSSFIVDVAMGQIPRSTERISSSFYACFSVENTIQVSKFADDSKIFRGIHDSMDSRNLQKDLDTIIDWADKWQMDFNISKCKVMHAGKPILRNHTI